MKNRLQFLERNSLDEVVFQNRNRNYGAYVMRSDYSNNLTKSLFLGIGVFVAASLVPLAISHFSPTKIIEVPPVIAKPYILDNVDPPIKKPEQIQTAQQNIKTVSTIVPTPTRNSVVDQPLPSKKDLENAALGLITKDGEDANVIVAPVGVIGPTTSGPISVPIVEIPLDPEKVFSNSDADVSAGFKGGIDAFRKRVINSFDTGSVADESIVSAVITFVVEKDGSISNIKVSGDNSAFNKEAERTVKSIRTKWTPAQFKGKSVRSSFRMPISMKID